MVSQSYASGVVVVLIGESLVFQSCCTTGIRATVLDLAHGVSRTNRRAGNAA